MRNLHQIILEEYGMKALHLLRDWEKLQIRAVITGIIEFLHLDASARDLFQSVLG